MSLGKKKTCLLIKAYNCKQNEYLENKPDSNVIILGGQPVEINGEYRMNYT
jgi:hypothetical protein